MIHVCFGLHDANGRYSKFVGTAMASIFENTAAPVTIHILHDTTLIDDNRDKFSYLAGRYGQHVKFYNVEELCPGEINFLYGKLADKINLRFSIGTFYRLMIKKILGTGKIIYLDADIIVNLDIIELWRQDLQNFPVAAVPEIDATQGFIITQKFLLNADIVKLENYFCAGVMIFDLDKLDEKFFYEGVQFLADNPACESLDQDILNAFFSENYLKLEQKFDSFVQAERLMGIPLTQKIYHYAGQCVEPKLAEEYNRLFLENFTRTPWFNIDVLDRICETFRMAQDENTLQFERIMPFCVEHRRAFFVEPQNLDVIKIIFSICDDEPIIENRDADSINELISKMSEQQGQRLFFICLSDYRTTGIELLKHGFNEHQDFVNGLEFMTREQCDYSRPEYRFIQAL